MKNTDLAKKIKELRTRKGFSQDELAETAQINLRTVQRIESGETEPRGDTLKRLAMALNVTADELIDWAEQEDNGFLVLLNLSALTFIVFPLLGVVVPLALWFLKKDKIKNLNGMGKSLINFQISWCILMFLIYAFVMGSFIFHWRISGLAGISLGGIELMVIIIPLLYLLNGIFVIVNTYRSYNGKTVFYKPAFRLLR
ncbi:MAG: helix-turn-helix domain-containing protein [Bacteroidota bacterium]